MLRALSWIKFILLLRRLLWNTKLTESVQTETLKKISSLFFVSAYSRREKLLLGHLIFALLYY